jgi:uncharacterized RDD family membrane protein YckC
MEEQPMNPEPTAQAPAEPASTTTMYFAGIGTRFIASIVDSIFLGIIGGVLGVVIGNEDSNTLISVLIGLAYYVIMIGSSGQTLGCRLMHIRVVTTDNGQVPGYGTATVRYLSSFISAFVLMLGYIWAFFNPQRQTWHDMIARTYVVKA